MKEVILLFLFLFLFIYIHTSAYAYNDESLKNYDSDVIFLTKVENESNNKFDSKLKIITLESPNYSIKEKLVSNNENKNDKNSNKPGNDRGTLLFALFILLIAMLIGVFFIAPKNNVKK